jgi:hypothetical protein
VTFRRISHTGEGLPIGKRDGIDLGKVAPASLAICGGKAFYSVPEQSRIGIIDLATGDSDPDIKIEGVQGLAKETETMLLVCAGSQVVRLNAATRQTKTVLSDLDAPTDVACDKEGNIYVSELGKTQQIKKFSPQKKLLLQIGVKGGRGTPATPYNPSALRGASKITIGSDNNLWITEPYQAPRRVGVFSPTDGKWIRDIYGPARCGHARNQR